MPHWRFTTSFKDDTIYLYTCNSEDQFDDGDWWPWPWQWCAFPWIITQFEQFVIMHFVLLSEQYVTLLQWHTASVEQRYPLKFSCLGKHWPLFCFSSSMHLKSHGDPFITIILFACCHCAFLLYIVTTDLA